MTQPTTPAAPTPTASEALSALPPGSPERAAAAAALYNERNNPPGTVLPEGVPAKFVNATTGEVDVQALLASYTELEKKLGQPAAKPADPADPAAPAAAAKPADPAAPLKLEIPEGVDPVSHVVTQAGLDANALAAKVTKDGKLDDADYAAIEKLGIPRALIDQHVALVKANVEAAQAANMTTAMGMFGGEQQTRDALDWAAANLPAEEAARLNAKLAGAEWADAVEVIKAKWTAARGTPEPTLVRGGPGGGGVVGYRSIAERSRDMNDPRYQKDPAFREQVRQKMQVSRYDLDR